MGRTLVVLNAQAGTVRDVGAEKVRAQVDEALTLPGQDVDVRVLEGAEMVATIRDVRRSGYDTLVVGAGDGTVSFAASVLCGSDVTLGVLPLGTMNLLAYDIGLPRDLAAALEALRAAKAKRIDLATLNGRAFHGVSGLGFFTQMAMAREQMRTSRGRVLGWFMALGRAVVRSGRLSLELEIEGQRAPIDAYAALVTNNVFDMSGWHRSRLDAGVLEIHVAEDRGALARIKAGADLLVEAWRDNPGIHSFQAKAVTIHGLRRRRAWVATDGEITRETLPLRYEVAPGALSLLLPPDAAQWKDEAQPQVLDAGAGSVAP
ncbi:diacylglycerol/lipid kinase family protein [Aquabacter sp. P-9]|uniref:diacylglycerol/lipid kinase family protein n=1 Tax=Aquabacter sediminis TaxID=3029197 RepID=UPI00237D6B63|nr:diacylglycerol kinase family protein [Aquabacter sp. P-9]MDE1566917.1 diacylglycerol kinase family protein [Aquabacter sp. P-9]